MSFLVAVLFLLLEPFPWVHRVMQRGDALLRRTLVACERQTWGVARWRLAAWVLLWTLPLALLWLALWPVAYGWLRLPLELALLLWASGRSSLREALPTLRSCGGLARNARDWRRWQGRLLWQSHEGLFAVLFWYALLGPLPAIVYRLLAIVCEQAEDAALRRSAVWARHALDWLPARALVLTLGLAGNLVTAGRVLWPQLLDMHALPCRLVVEGGRAAAELSAQPEEARQGLRVLEQLLNRALLIWMSAWALVVVLA